MDLTRHFSNIPGWRTSRKIIVFESDDWGSIRIPDRQTRDRLIASGVKVDQNYFTYNDCLESDEDVVSLFEVLSGFKDKKGRHPLFTTLHIMGNPDFEKIAANDKRNYFFQHIDDTCREYHLDPATMRKLWGEGMENQLIFPAFHGKEHLNVSRWMRALNGAFPITTLAFNNRVSGIHAHIAEEQRGEYQAAFDADNPEDVDLINIRIQEGLDLFESYFGFRSTYFVPPNGALPAEALPVISKAGIRFLNTSKIGKQRNAKGENKRFIRFLGNRSEDGLIFITRNASFEPSAENRTKDWVSKSLKQIEIAFQWNKPAIISTHRVNYCGGIETGNRSRGLFLLKDLIAKILKTWPEAEFLSSVELGEMISGKSG